MWLIITLIILGALLLAAEILLIPGLSVAGICAVICYGIAIYIGFDTYETAGGLTTIAASIILAIAAILLSLRSRMWRRFELKQNIDSVSQTPVNKQVKIGEQGVTLTRLAPLGKVEISGKTYEARSIADRFIDPDRRVEVVGHENFTLIIKLLENN